MNTIIHINESFWSPKYQEHCIKFFIQCSKVRQDYDYSSLFDYFNKTIVI